MASVAGLAFMLCLPHSLHAQAVSYPTERNYSEPSVIPPEHPLNILRMRVEVSFVPEQGLVKGTVTHIFIPLRERVDSVFFNGPGIRISKAMLNTRRLRFHTSPSGVTVYPDPPLRWNSTDSIRFEYEANPRRGLFFIGWNDTTGRRHKQIWSQGQGIDNRNWIPCYDEQNDKMITETIVRFDSSYQVLSNDSLISRVNNTDGTTTWHYCMTHPHATYLVMLGIGRYGIKTVHTRAGVPVHLYYYPEFPGRVEPTYMYSAECIDFVAQQTGIPYPWSRYSNIPVEDFLYGAMENTTATVYGDFLFVDWRGFVDRNYIAVNVHELTHQWFGDYITGRAPNMAWLHESFATLYPKLFLKTIYGEDYYEWMRRGEQDVALAASLQNRLPLVHSQAGSSRVYQKGSAVLDMMMHVFGEEQFRRVITYYLRRHAYANVETNDLYQAFQDTLGLSPRWFFDEWIYRGGEPHYEVSYENVSLHPDGKRQTEITVRQVQPVDELVGYFTMPVNFEVHYADGSFDRVRDTVSGQVSRIVVPDPKGRAVSFVLFDPGSEVLKQVTFAKSFEELKSQALHAPLMIDRFDAVAAMKPLEAAQKRKLLAGIFEKEKFFSIRAEIVEQLAQDSDAVSVDVIRKALHDPAVEVRAGALKFVTPIPSSLQPDFESLLKDSSYANETDALLRLSARFPERISHYLEVTKGDTGIGSQVLVAWHEVNAGRGDSASLRTLAEMCGPSREFRTRTNAMDAIKRLNYLDATVTANLLDAMLSSNSRLRGPATSTLEYFMAQSACKARIHAVYASTPWKDWQKAMLAPVLGAE